MKLVRLGKPAKWASLNMEAGRGYLFETQGVPAIARYVGGDLEVQTANPKWDIKELLAQPNKDWKILIVRAGGAGDVLFSTPTIRELKRLLPNSTIRYATSTRHPWLLTHNPHVSDILTYPLPVEEVTKCDHILNLEGVVEASNDAHAVDLIAQAAGVTVEDHSLDYSIGEGRLELAEKSIPREGKHRVAIQVKASAANRTYPAELLTKVIMGLMDLKIQCVLITEPKSLVIPDSWFPMCVNLGATTKPLRWEDSIAIAATADCFLTPDSSMHAFGAALGIPVVSLWGSFPSHIRLIKSATNEAIKGRGVCQLAPCCHHTGCGLPWPSNGPCSQSGRCEELASISPDTIINEVERVSRLGRKRRSVKQPSIAHAKT